MKSGIMAIVVFVAAFVLTTAALIFLNTQFMNIFKFNFTPVHVSMPSTPADSTAQDSTSIGKTVKNDSTKAIDSLKAITQNISPEKDSTKLADNKEPKTESKLPADNKTDINPPVSDKTKDVPDKSSVESNPKLGFVSGDAAKIDPVAYVKWKKSMAGIMEIMDSKKASQILRTYSDNIARDIFFTMKKKKAADILSKYDVKSDSIMIRKLTRMQ